MAVILSSPDTGYDCGKCHEDTKRLLACHGGTISDPKMYVYLDGELWDRCPVRKVTMRARRAIQMAGPVPECWPDEGGFLDQANAFVQAVSVIKALEEERRKKNAG